jgi:enoyl-CoA hydratase/carnithine racemase
VSIRREVEGSVGRLTLARPEKRNALSRTALLEITEAAAWFDQHPEVAVVVVAGEGPSFCAGFDLADTSWREHGGLEQSAAVGRAMVEAVAGMAAVTVATIQGHCVGGGVVLASACDLRLASEDARFRIPEIDLGVPLYWTGVPRLTRELGPALTKELVMTGRAFDATEARSIRFVNRVVAPTELADAAAELAAALAAKPADVLRTTKHQVEQAAPAESADDGSADVEGFGQALRAARRPQPS